MGAQMVHSNEQNLLWLEQKEPGRASGEETYSLHFTGQ